MTISNNIFVFLLLLTASFFPAYCGTGFNTHCMNFFVKEMKGLNKMKNGIINKCNDFLKNKNLNENNGCVMCSNRLPYNLYDMNKVDDKSEVMISVCLGSKNTCTTKFSGDSGKLFTEFFNTVMS